MGSHTKNGPLWSGIGAVVVWRVDSLCALLSVQTCPAPIRVIILSPSAFFSARQRLLRIQAKMFSCHHMPGQSSRGCFRMLAEFKRTESDIALVATGLIISQNVLV